MTEYRIHGPPGCAKTTQLKESVDKAAKSFTSSGVLVTAFSKAAAQELVSRGLSVDKSQVGTLHAFCFRGLGKPTIAETRVDEWNESSRGFTLKKRGIEGEDFSDTSPELEENVGDDLLLRSTSLRAMRVARERWPSDVRRFDDRWRAWKSDKGYMDFTDLLEVGLSSLSCAPGKPDAIFVDEAQDLSPLEIALVRSWGARAKYYVLCGDSDQCIYAFRGASPTSFLEPAIPAEQNRLLTQSYRVSGKVHALAQRVIRRCRYRFAVDYLPTQEVGSVRRAGYNIGCATDLLRDVVRDLEAGKSVMVLSACAYQLRPFLGACRGAGVPYHNPYRQANGEWNAWRDGPKRLRSMLLPVSQSLGGGGLQPTYADVWSAVERIGSVLVDGARERARSSASMFAELRVDDEWWRGLFQPRAWSELRLAMDTGARATSDWYERVLDERGRGVAYACRAVRRVGAGVLDSEPRLTVGTIHSVKGAEADVVYLSPDLSAQGVTFLHKMPNNLDFMARLFYVGVTRARTTVVLLEPTDGKHWEM